MSRARVNKHSDQITQNIPEKLLPEDLVSVGPTRIQHIAVSEAIQWLVVCGAGDRLQGFVSA